MRLCLDRQDYVRAQILSRKISPRAFNADTSKEKKKPKEGDNVVEEPAEDIPSLLELKRIYYELMIRYLFPYYLWLCKYCSNFIYITLWMMFLNFGYLVFNWILKIWKYTWHWPFPYNFVKKVFSSNLRMRTMANGSWPLPSVFE